MMPNDDVYFFSWLIIFFKLLQISNDSNAFIIW